MYLAQFRHYVIELSHRHGPLVLVQTLVALANTLANSFALIYLVRQGHDYIDCCIFVLISTLVPTVLVAFASRAIVSQFSSSMVTGLTCLAGYYVLLAVLEGWPLVLLPPALFGTYIVTFWVPYNALVMHITSRKKRGAVIGVYFLVFPLVSVLTPMVGGVLIHAASYQLLFGLGTALAIADIVYILGYRVLRKLRERIIIPELLQSLVVNLLGRRRADFDMGILDWRLKSALFAEGVQDGIFWIFVPLVSFEFAGSEVGAAGFFSLFAFWGAVMTVLLGYLSDRLKDRADFVRAGSAFAAVSVMAASFARSPEQFVSSMSFAYFWLAMIPSFLFTILLDKLERFKKKGVVVREFLLNAGRSVGATVVMLLMLLGADLSLSMAVAGIALASIIVVR